MINKELIKKAVAKISAQFNPQRIILFGSYARGTADDKSDVDLLVICPLKKRRRTLMLEMDRVLKGLKLARDIVVLSPGEFEIEKEISGTIARYAWKEGKPLYEHKQKSK